MTRGLTQTNLKMSSMEKEEKKEITLFRQSTFIHK